MGSKCESLTCSSFSYIICMLHNSGIDGKMSYFVM